MDERASERRQVTNTSLWCRYIPDDNALRGRCFILMTMISALHNLSRSLGCALLSTSSIEKLTVVFLGSEMALYLFSKLLRGDFFYWMRIEGRFFSIVAGVVGRTCGKIIAVRLASELRERKRGAKRRVLLLRFVASLLVGRSVCRYRSCC